MQCDFQVTRKLQLDKHVSLKHSKKINNDNMAVGTKCKNCGEPFTIKGDLMRHRKAQHIESVAPCRNNAEMCW